MFVVHRANEATAHDALGGWVELADVSGTGPATGAEAQWKPDAFDETCFASWTTSSNAGAICVELNIASAIPPTGGQVISWDLVMDTCPAGGLLAGPIHYDVRWNARRIVALAPCDPNDPLSTTCPVYSEFAWTGDSTFTDSVDTGEPDLAPGEIMTYEVTAVDGEGRGDCGST
jgi:hypothetical protein